MLYYDLKGGFMNKENKMGYAPILPLILKMSLPAMFSMLIQSLYNIVDSYFVGKISEEALRATSLSFPIQIMIIAFGVGTGVGVSSYVARSLGANRQKEADNAAMHGLVLALLTWLVMIFFGVFLSRPFISIFTSNENVIEMGHQYLAIISGFGIFSLIHIVGEKTIQGSGNMIIPMIAQTVGAVINIILDPIFIFTFGMGIKGAAIATIIGQSFSALISLYGLFRKESLLKMDFKNFKFNVPMVKQIYEVGFPSILMQSVGAFLVIFLNRIVGQFTEVAVSVLGVYFKLESFVMMPVYGLGQGILPLVAFNYGAHQYERIHQTYHYGVRISFVLMLIGLIIFQIFPAQLMGIFTDDMAMILMGVRTLRIISLYFIPASLAIINSIYFQSMGIGRYSLIVSFLRQIGLLLPLAHLFANFGLDYVWFAYPVAEILALFVSMHFYRKTNEEKLLTSN